MADEKKTRSAAKPKSDEKAALSLVELNKASRDGYAKRKAEAKK
jgi:hypothetical protein